ncbi:MAG: response regulator, partial [Desulfonatronovibrio sp.]
EGHEVKTAAYGQEIVLSIPKNIILLQKLEEELKEIVLKIPGVKKVSTELSSDFPKKRFINESPKSENKLLLVDDEREFVHRNLLI